MPAPTALLNTAPAPEEVPLPVTDQDDEVLLDATAALPQGSVELQPTKTDDTEMIVDEEGRPRFAPARDVDRALRREQRKVPIPPNRMTPLKNNWSKIYPPLVEHLRLAARRVELRTTPSTTSTSALQTGADFISAFALGFDVDDAIALLRLDSLYIQSFEIKDVKTLNPEALSRAIGRIAGKGGSLKYSIENATKTRIVLADSRIHILGAFDAITAARESIVSLILGQQPGKVFNNLRIISARMKERQF
ncbi:eukaryotic type KH-domain (KH-domain type I) [Thozetella sp. PMI_491]|nr:eukaryotic type KH-domain (KH-domain type I) [Thozetella sp. PMI_491]